MFNPGFKIPLLISVILLTAHSHRGQADETPAVKTPADKRAYSVDRIFPQIAPGIVLEAASAAATDLHGNILIFHRGSQPILKLDRQGKLIRAFGEGLFKSPHGLRIDGHDFIWVTDNANHTVMKFSPDGNQILLRLGERNVAGDDETHFDKPTDVAFAANGDFYVADGYGNSRIVKFDKAGKYLFAWGKKGNEPGEFNLPHAVQVDAQGQVYVGDRENDRIQVFDSSGKFLRQIKGIAPFGLFLTVDQHLFVADGRANRVVMMTLDGTELASWGKLGDEPGSFRMPHGLTVARDGAVIVTEITGKRVQRFVPHD